MNVNYKLPLLLSLSGVALGLLLIILGQVYQDKDERKQGANIENISIPQFEKIEQFVFKYNYGKYPVYAEIYKDKKTDVEYLYLWEGVANGGPAITRYYRSVSEK
jgi:hypothetical protein